MRSQIETCPECGALITPQLARCRQCKKHLRGSALEGWISSRLAAPGTALLLMLTFGYYGLMCLLAGPREAPAFSFYSLSQLGSTFSPGIFQGQHWRFVTSMFAHADLMHLFFNAYALSIAGRLTEEAFDQKKMLLLFFIAGVGSMAVSHFFYVDLRGAVLRGSVGASGAIAGLIGATLVAARRIGPRAREVQQAMWRWALLLVVFGLVVGGIDNAAHLGGFALGAALAALFPLGPARGRASNWLLSTLLFLAFTTLLVSTALMLNSARGFPFALEDDEEPQRLLGITLRAGADDRFSAQTLATERCLEGARDNFAAAERAARCEFALRVNPGQPLVYELAALAHDELGDSARAEALREVLRRFGR